MVFSEYKQQLFAFALSGGYTPEEAERLLSYAEKLISQGVPVIYNQDHLSRLLGYEYSYLLAVCNSQELCYKKYEIPKKNGGSRILEEPLPSLKEIQYWILKNILEPISSVKVSPAAKAFMPNKCLRDNARFHKSKNCIVALDLHDFFGSVHYGSVFTVFQSIGYTKQVCTMLANLCICHNALPQGAPTSPMLSNLVFKHLDDKIFSYCRRRNIMYTRYADDLTFSSNNLNASCVIKYIKMIVHTQGFRINDEKTKVMGKGMQQNVTGVIVRSCLNFSRKFCYT
ncbi:MAG: reverse transcriptase family protein [Bacteroidaceae bacterium]|nr:reverse transcriptase family protein [Bacteroidaceae bacterium]